MGDTRGVRGGMFSSPYLHLGRQVVGVAGRRSRGPTSASRASSIYFFTIAVFSAAETVGGGAQMSAVSAVAGPGRYSHLAIAALRSEISSKVWIADASLPWVRQGVHTSSVGVDV